MKRVFKKSHGIGVIYLITKVQICYEPIVKKIVRTFRPLTRTPIHQDILYIVIEDNPKKAEMVLIPFSPECKSLDEMKQLYAKHAVTVSYDDSIKLSIPGQSLLIQKVLVTEENAANIFKKTVQILDKKIDQLRKTLVNNLFFSINDFLASQQGAYRRILQKK